MDRSVDDAEPAALATGHRPSRVSTIPAERSSRSWEPPRWGASGVNNFRDLAEATGSSDLLRSGLIYRSDTLHRCRRPEIEQIAALGIRRVLEINAQPETEPDIARMFRECGIVVVRIPMVKDRAALVTCSGPNELAEFYLDLAAANSGAIVLCMAEIIAGAAAHEPLVIQGTTGTDRTGVVTALALTLAGVDDHRIALDYARSAKAAPATMMAFLSGIRRHYGSVEEFLIWGGAHRGELDRCASLFR